MAENLNPLFVSDNTPIAAKQPKLNSVKDDPTSRLVQEFRNTLAQLGQLWDQVHLDGNTRSIRVEQVCEYVCNLLREIVTVEENSVRNLASDLEARREAVKVLRTLFNQNPFDESAYPKGSLALLKALDAEMNRLQEKRDTLMTKQKEYCEKYGILSKRLGVYPEEIDGIFERIFTEAELSALRNKVAEMKNIYTKRFDKAFQLQNEANKIFEIVQLPTNNSFGEEDQQYLKMDLHAQETVLSDELLNKLVMLNQRLKDHYDSWIEQVAFRYDELLVKLDALSTKCFRPPVSKDYPEKFNPDRLNEKEIAKLEQELQERQEIYNRAEPVFDKLNEWMEAWKQKLDTERRVCRASFYKNRGGSLNAKLKQRRMLDQKVPKLFNELHQLCEEYVKNYRVFDILVDGMRADKYAEHVLKSYEQDREMQKAQKQISTSRVAQTPGPGRNRNIYATSTPSRHAMRKLMLNPPATIAATTISGRKRSFSCSQLSAIHPLASPMSGPRTSSPKPEWS